MAVGYREQRLADEARALRDLGIEFHDRAATAFKNIAELGAALERTVSKYNAFVGSYESRLEPTLKKFEDHRIGNGDEIKCKYEKKDGKNLATFFKKAGGC